MVRPWATRRENEVASGVGARHDGGLCHVVRYHVTMRGLGATALSVVWSRVTTQGLGAAALRRAALAV